MKAVMTMKLSAANAAVRGSFFHINLVMIMLTCVSIVTTSIITAVQDVKDWFIRKMCIGRVKIHTAMIVMRKITMIRIFIPIVISLSHVSVNAVMRKNSILWC